MSNAFDQALAAAHAVAGAQHYPAGCLYMVATPIGNLADLSLRALHVLQMVDTIACEDTRHTAQLLGSIGLHKPLLALHQHNENEAARAVVAQLQAGQRVAYVSDAGTPGISDPGARLCAAVADAGLRRMPIPGASSVTGLVSVAGLTDAHAGGFVFHGFLPAKGHARQQALDTLAQHTAPTVLLEAPHRVLDLAHDMAQHPGLSTRTLTVGRELTKQFEQVYTVAAHDWPAYLQASAQHQKGEFVLLMHPAPAVTVTDDALPALAQNLLDALLPEMPLKKAVQLVVKLTGAPKNLVYAQALLQKENGN